MTTQFQNQHKILRAEKSRNTYSADILANNITEIHYDPASGKNLCFVALNVGLGTFQVDFSHKDEK